MTTTVRSTRARWRRRPAPRTALRAQRDGRGRDQASLFGLYLPLRERQSVQKPREPGVDPPNLDAIQTWNWTFVFSHTRHTLPPFAHLSLSLTRRTALLCRRSTAPTTSWLICSMVSTATWCFRRRPRPEAFARLPNAQTRRQGRQTGSRSVQSYLHKDRSHTRRRR